MSKKAELNWKEKSDIESREILVIQAFDANSLMEAYSKLFDTSNEREIISLISPIRISALILKGYETPSFQMRQESNKMIAKIEKLLNELKISKNWQNEFWGFMSLQADTLLERIEQDLDAISNSNSKSSAQDQKVLVNAYNILRNQSKAAVPKVEVKELQLGF